MNIVVVGRDFFLKLNTTVIIAKNKTCRSVGNAAGFLDSLNISE
jgi:hypothetical protein